MRTGLYEPCARISNDCLKEGIRFLPIRSARRRIPRAALGLKKYLSGASGVLMYSDNIDATSRLGDSEVLTVKHSPRHTIPEFVQRLEYDGEVSSSVASEKTVDVLEDKDLRTTLSSKSSNLKKEPRLSSSKSVTSSHSCKGEVLAGESCGPNIGSWYFGGLNIADVPGFRDACPAFTEHAMTVVLQFTLKDRFDPSSLKSKVETADPGKERSMAKLIS